MRKRNGKGHNKTRRNPRTSTRSYPLTQSDLKRGMEIGARVDNAEIPRTLVYIDESRIVKAEEPPKPKWYE